MASTIDGGSRIELCCAPRSMHRLRNEARCARSVASVEDKVTLQRLRRFDLQFWTRCPCPNSNKQKHLRAVTNGQAKQAEVPCLTIPAFLPMRCVS